VPAWTFLGGARFASRPFAGQWLRNDDQEPLELPQLRRDLLHELVRFVTESQVHDVLFSSDERQIPILLALPPLQSQLKVRGPEDAGGTVRRCI